MPAYKDKKRGTWFVQYSVTTEDGKVKQVRKRGFSTKRDAQIWEAEQKTLKATRTGRTFEEMFEASLVALDSSDSSAARKRGFLRKHFQAYSEPFEKITREDLVNWRNGLKAKNLAPRTMNLGIGYVKAVYSYAERVYQLPNCAAVMTPYKLTSAEKKERPVWTPEQFDQFLECVPEAWQPFFIFLFWTGCRRGEALAVCRDDLQGNRIRIDKSIKHYKNGFLGLKNDASARVISLDSKTMAAIEPLIEHADPFIFGGKRSLAISSLQRVFSQAKKDSGVPNIRLHDLRHSHATILINSGVNIVAVSKRLGHASINQTLKTYTHLLKKTDDELLAKVEELRKTEK